MRAHYAKPGGRFINQIDMENRRRVVYLGTKLAEDLFGNEDPVGKIVTIDNIPFTVVGVMEKKNQMGIVQRP